MRLLLKIAAVFFTVSWAAILSTLVTHPNHKKPSRTRMVKDACSVQAWVRAEDLSPSMIANGASFSNLTQASTGFHEHPKNPGAIGELRIKVNPACTEEISSVALQLQLDEFGQVRSLWVAAYMYRQCGNQLIILLFRLTGKQTLNCLHLQVTGTYLYL